MYNDGGTAALTNCVFWANTADSNSTVESAQIDGLAPVVTFSCIQDDIAGDANIPFGGTANNNIDTDPLFVRNPDDGGDGWGAGGNDDFGNLRLLSGSDCIDAGNNTAVPEDIADLDGDGDTAEPMPWDLVGEDRFRDDPDAADTGYAGATGLPVVDMGAYEFINPSGDFDEDGFVNLRDFAMLAAAWKSTQGQDNYNPACDISEPADEVVDLMDFIEFVNDW